MAKRTSFEEKNKFIHPTRKKIIDTVFGRTDDNQKTFGYEKEVDKKREVGEKWVDADGKEWEQKEGYKTNVTKMDEVRKYIENDRAFFLLEEYNVQPSVAYMTKVRNVNEDLAGGGHHVAAAPHDASHTAKEVESHS
jgi:hypothetical protein